MPIRVIHGNGDLIGAAFQGLGEGAAAFTDARNQDRALDDREARTAEFQKRTETEAARMAEELRMDQELHAAKMQRFNQEMFDREALSNWRRNAAQYDGPNEFAVQRQTLMDTDLPPEIKAQEFALLDAEEQAAMRDKAALGYRARIGEMIRQNPELAEQSLVAQQLADPAAMEGLSHEELPGVLQDLEQDFRLLRQQQRDDMAFAEAGQRLSKLSTDPNLGYGMQEQIPRIVEGMADKYPPQAMNNLLAGLSGEVPMSSLMDGGATEAATREYLLKRQQEAFAMTPEGRAAITEQARRDALGDGGNQVPAADPGDGGRTLQDEAQFREAQLAKRTERLAALERDLGNGDGGRSWAFAAGSDKRKALREVRALATKDPNALQDEATVLALFEKYGLDPNDEEAGEMLGNAASLPAEEFNRLIGSVKDVDAKVRKEARKELERLRREVKSLSGGEKPRYTVQEIMDEIQEASNDPTGAKWSKLSPDARLISDFFLSPQDREAQQKRTRVNINALNPPKL